MKKYLSVFVLALVLVVGLGYKAQVTHAAPGTPECSDGIDNNGNGLIDDKDPGCHLDGDATNPASYDATIWQEAGASLPCPGCTNITVVPPPDGGGGGWTYPPTPVPTPTPTPTPVVVPTPTPKVLGISQVACGVATGRPCELEKTGGAIDPRLEQNREANALAVKEGDSLVISKLGINKPVLQLKTINNLFREAMILPWTSTPDKGGNTVLVGHAYYLRNGVYSKSTFYELDTMKAGDEITMNWKGKSYTYVVTEMKKVKPTDITVEDQTADPTLTIYSCGRFTNVTRTVVVATLKK